VFQVSFFAPLMLALGLMDELADVSSIAGSRVHPFAGSAYSTSKAALAALTREMAADFAPRGVRVNTISPGEIDTSILSPGTEKLIADIPMRRLGLPEGGGQSHLFPCAPSSRATSTAPSCTSMAASMCKPTTTNLPRLCFSGIRMKRAFTIPRSGKVELLRAVT
jgi:NAD(P)-dependent dehydrogenase (short-subunit alcohol dehydrogenase family)